LFGSLFQAASKVEVDPEAGAKLRVTRSDFLHSLANDVKPVSILVVHNTESPQNGS